MASEMTEAEIIQRAGALRDLQASRGWSIVCEVIDRKIAHEWESFIKMPVDKKTSKAAQATQARYLALKELKDLPEAEARLTENRLTFAGRK